MAYAAVISLKQTIKPLLNPSHILIDQSSSRRIIQPLYDDVCSLQEVLKQLNSSSRSSISRKRVNALDGDMRDAVSEFEDVVESHFSNWFQKSLGEEEIDHDPLMDLLELKQDIDSFTQNVNKMKAAYINELRYLSRGDDDDDAVEIIRSRIDLIGRNDESKMVGLSDLFTKIKKDITVGSFCSRVVLLSLVGMAGIGKTTLAKKLYHDPLILSHFERRAFVSLGCKYQLKTVLLDILKQVNHHDDFDDPGENMMIITKGEEEEVDSLTRMISESLMGRRYLIVLDDVWDVKFNDQFTSLLFPWIDNYGSQILMTTRLREAARTINWYGGTTYDIRFLDKNESWDLLRAKVFGEESSSCPTELEKAGKKIAENCEGLPLTIVTVADILSKSYENSVAAAVDKQKQNSVDDKTKLEYWNEVAADKQHSVFVDAYDQMWEVLYPSYDYLDQHLKPCFLYMGVFPQNHEITCSKLFNLWIAEGFSESNGKKSPAYFARSFLFQLSSSNVVLDHKTSLNNKTKICGLISPFWHLCVKEAAKTKFFHGLNKRADGLVEDRMKGQRRLSIRNNVLFVIKDVFDSMGSVSTVRSILCTGSYHEYPVPICVGGSRLLMILDALTVHLYEFPIEVVVNLVQLTYLALTFDGKIPPFISKLWNLHYLIVHRKLSIVERNGNSLSYLPMEIWELKELEHLQVIGRNLPHPPKSEGALLPKLSGLLDVSPQSCTADVFERMPNLRKLGIRIVLAIDDDEPLSFFDHIFHISKLKRLKCIVVNPKMIMSSEGIVPLSVLPSSLVKLTLSGLGYSWEEMSKISSLPNLKVLKLQCYAFQGPKWHVKYNEFKRLKFLQIEDTNLVKWTYAEYLCISGLRRLIMKHCYKLEEIPYFTGFMEEIELVDCNPVAVDCAKMRLDQRKEISLVKFVLNIHSSCD